MEQDWDTEALKAAYGLQEYHVNHTMGVDRLIGFRGKTVLEVGGCLPSDFVFDVLKAGSWHGMEDLHYWASIAESETIADSNYLGRAGSRIAEPVSVRYPGGPSHIGRYATLVGRIQDLGPSFNDYYDLVYSMAAFEHIHGLDAALISMYRALRPGGVLVSVFAPIWSGPGGHHLPPVAGPDGRPINLSELGLSRHAHLLLGPEEMRAALPSLPEETIKIIVDYIYVSDHINRLFYEDYIRIIERTPFRQVMIRDQFVVDLPEETRRRLDARHPGYRRFEPAGMLVWLQRPETG